MLGWFSEALTCALVLEARQPSLILREGRRQQLDGRLAVQPRIAGVVDLAHATGAQRREDLVGAEADSAGKRHRVSTYFTHNFMIGYG